MIDIKYFYNALWMYDLRIDEAFELDRVLLMYEGDLLTVDEGMFYV